MKSVFARFSLAVALASVIAVASTTIGGAAPASPTEVFVPFMQGICGESSDPGKFWTGSGATGSPVDFITASEGDTIEVVNECPSPIFVYGGGTPGTSVEIAAFGQRTVTLTEIQLAAYDGPADVGVPSMVASAEVSLQAPTTTQTPTTTVPPVVTPPTAEPADATPGNPALTG